MTSKIKVDNINKVSDDSNIIKKCGTTTTIGSGASNPIVVDGSAVTIGRCGGTVALASGASQTGFGRTGTVDWQTGSIKTGTFTAANGEGYFCNTSGGAFTVNLPAGSAGAIVSVSDYTRTFQTNNLTIAPNGSEKIGGVASDAILNTEGQTATFVYVDGTEGWINTQETSNSVTGNTNLIATGGTITTSGNCKIHTFTGPGTFTVSQVSGCAANNLVSYLVVAGGGGGGDTTAPAPGGGAGGGGAGGFREVKSPVTPYTASPLDGYPSSPNRITVTATAFPIVVGAGGNGATPSGNGGVSTFSTITSAGGGAGGETGLSPSGSPPNTNGQNGGSGGGAPAQPGFPIGNGNTPPTTPPQGNNGGSGASGGYAAGGGGGATAVGGNAAIPGAPNPGGGGGCGGAGATTSINATPTAYAGGGGAGVWGPGGGANPTNGGAGGGGKGAGTSPGTNATANTGGGGGGGSSSITSPSATGVRCASNGGSGIVIIRYKFQ
jgi:hypothetical protein